MGGSASVNTVLVTGAAGLIGSAVVKSLLLRNVRVVACDNFSLGEWQGEEEGISWERADITDASFYERLHKYFIDAVVHCAAHPGGRSLKEPVLDVNVNAYGSMQLFEWCARQKIPIVYLSSSSVYGHQPERPIPETASLDPGTIYAVCKVACENFLRILGEGYGLQWTVLRLFATYGAGHTPNTFQGIVNVMTTQLLSGNRVVVKGSLNRQRDIIYVDDVAISIINALFFPDAYGQIINIGTGTSITISELIKTIIKCVGKDLRNIEIIEEQGTAGDPFYNVADCSKAKRILGFTPAYDLERGITMFVDQRKVRENLRA